MGIIQLSKENKLEKHLQNFQGSKKIEGKFLVLIVCQKQHRFI